MSYGIAVPGTVVPSGSQASPAGAQGIQGATGGSGATGPTGPQGSAGAPGSPGAAGANSWTLSTASFTVPAVGASATINVNDTSWAVIGEYVWVQDGVSAGVPLAMQITAKTATSLTLLNPVTAGNSPSGDPGNLITRGSDSLLYLPPSALNPINTLVGKSAAYTLTVADSGKYFYCTNGSWTLTLPAPSAGLLYRVRNDQGISGTTGTITVQTNGGLINGASSLVLLPQQDCTIISDGTNWRTHGLQREVILGTLDITSATASATVLLPVGYRLFVLDFAALVCSTDGAGVQLFFSSDGGSTFYNANYFNNSIYNNGVGTITTASNNNLAYGYVGGGGIGSGNALQLKIYPGSSAQRPSWLGQNNFYYNAGSWCQQMLCSGFLAVATNVVMNAAKIALSGGTINNIFLTVKGIV